MEFNLLSLPAQIQIAAASGYAAYMTASVGIRAHHTTTQTAFTAAAYGLIATAVLAGAPDDANPTRYRVAKIEQAEDMAVSALHAYVKALGGRLELAVEFPDRPTVMLQRKRRRWVASMKLHDLVPQRGDGS